MVFILVFYLIFLLALIKMEIIIVVMLSFPNQTVKNVIQINIEVYFLLHLLSVFVISDGVTMEQMNYA